MVQFLIIMVYDATIILTHVFVLISYRTQLFFWLKKILFLYIVEAQSCFNGCKGGTCEGFSVGCLKPCKQGKTHIFCCPKGSHGIYCTESCIPNCNLCMSSSSCLECNIGYYGINCSQCTEHCYQCSSKNNCSVCDLGFFGKTCTEHCSPGCEYNICDKVTGHCDFGCRQNYTNPRCSKCKSGYHGEDCTEPCSLGCVDRMCLANGTCLLGCKSDKYNGNTCYIKNDTNATAVVTTVSEIGTVFKALI